MYLLLDSLTNPDRKIQAIKGVRAVTNYDLRDAKQVIDQLIGNSIVGTTASPQKLLDGAEIETLRNALDVLEDHGVNAEIIGEPIPEDLYERGVLAALLLMGGEHWVGACESALSRATDLAAVTGNPEFDVAARLLKALHERAVENGLY